MSEKIPTWTPEQLKKEEERTKSDAQLINEGAEYVIDDGAHEPRLDLRGDAQAIIDPELIERGEKVELKETFYDIVLGKIEELKKTRELNLGDIGIWRDLPSKDQNFADAIFDFLEKFDGKIVRVDDRNFIALRCCSDCFRSHLFEVSDEDRRIIEDAYNGNIRNQYEFSESIEGAGDRVEEGRTLIMPAGQLSRLVNKMAEKLLEEVVNKKKKEEEYQEKKRQEDIKKTQEDKIRKEKEALDKFDPSI